jgi:hypothetical protein
VKRAVRGLIVVLAHWKIDRVRAPGRKEHSPDGGEAQVEASTSDWGIGHGDVLSEEFLQAEQAYSSLARGPI